MRRITLSLFILVFTLTTGTPTRSYDQPADTPGRLEAFDGDGRSLGLSPLKHTRVKADISGFLARVTVEQEFGNDFAQPVEAVYTFPLPDGAAVDEMTMRIGERTVRGRIMKRAAARELYERAKTEGRTAALLDQERPNVFTQSVANILPGERIFVRISYVETLRYKDGSYEFVFPMTVGPRYVPAAPAEVKDAARISPPVAPARRAGHDVSLEVSLDAGLPVENITSVLHRTETLNLSPNSARITLKNEREIPNRDFILRYDVTGKRIEDAVLTHRSADGGGYFALMLAPPDDLRVADVSPKEIVFVLDTSGSMSGLPIEKAKEAMKLSLEGLYPDDTFNLITFAGDTRVLFDKPVPPTQANLDRARRFLETRQGGGGTEMMEAIRAALAPSGSPEHIRIVSFMTDGFIGNESQILAEIQKHPGARIFSFGIGNSVNRFLIEKMAGEGRGEARIVTLAEDGSKAAEEFHERIRHPLLTDISVDWNGLPVADVYPQRIPDLFDARPVWLSGRYTQPKSGTIRLRGKVGGQFYEREIKVEFPERKPQHDVLGQLWARNRIADLNSKLHGAEGGKRGSLEETIAGLGLEFGLMTEYTSFVAVEELVRTQNGKPVRVEVPVELADGTFGSDTDTKTDNLNYKPSPLGVVTRKSKGIAGGSGVGTGSGAGRGFGPPPAPSPPAPPPSKRISGGVLNGKAVSLPVPAYPQGALAANMQGSVAVHVTIDEEGNVLAAEPVSGHPLLRASAVSAARRAKFAPTLLAGKPVRVSGVIVYNFCQYGCTPVHLNGDAADEYEPAVYGAAEEKLHFWLYELTERRAKGDRTVTRRELDFVNSERARIRIHLTERSPALEGHLTDLGFEPETNDEGKLVLTGRIAVERLAELAGAPGIRYIVPAVTRSADVPSAL